MSSHTSPDLLLLAGLLLARAANAQSNSAEISGAITDFMGMPIGGPVRKNRIFTVFSNRIRGSAWTGRCAE